jgi:hypothetical protein
MDVCEIISPLQQGGEDGPTHSQSDESSGLLNNQLVDIKEPNSVNDPPEDLSTSGD